MSEARQLHRDIVEFVDAAQNEMLTKLQYVDKIFGNVNYLTTVEQENFTKLRIAIKIVLNSLETSKRTSSISLFQKLE